MADRKLNIEVAVVDQASKVLGEIAKKVESLDKAAGKSGKVALGVTLEPPGKKEVELLRKSVATLFGGGAAIKLPIQLSLPDSSIRAVQKKLDSAYKDLSRTTTIDLGVRVQAPDLSALKVFQRSELKELVSELQKIGPNLRAAFGDLGSAAIDRKVQKASVQLQGIAEVLRQGVRAASAAKAINRVSVEFGESSGLILRGIGQFGESAGRIRQQVRELEAAFNAFADIDVSRFKEVGANTRLLTDSIRYITRGVDFTQNTDVTKTVKFFVLAAKEFNKIPAPTVDPESIRNYRKIAAALSSSTEFLNKLEFKSGGTAEVKRLLGALQVISKGMDNLTPPTGGAKAVNGYTSIVRAFSRFVATGSKIPDTSKFETQLLQVVEALELLEATVLRANIDLSGIEKLDKVSKGLRNFIRTLSGQQGPGSPADLIAKSQQIGIAVTELFKQLEKVKGIDRLEKTAKAMGTLGRAFKTFAEQTDKRGAVGQIFVMLQRALKGLAPIAEKAGPAMLEAARGLRALNRSLKTLDARMVDLPDRAAEFAENMETAGKGISRFERSAKGAAEDLGILSRALKIVERQERKTRKGFLSGLAALAGYNRGVLKLRDGLTILSRSFGVNAVGITSIGLAIRKGVTDFLDYSRALNDVRTIMDETTLSFAQADKNVRRVAISLGLSEIDVAAGLYQTLSAGVTDTAQAMIVLEGAAGLAVAGSASVAETVDLLTTTINAFNVDVTADSVENLNDVLFETVRLAKTTVPELARSIGQIAPFAAQANVSLEETLGALAALTLGGKKTSQAVVQLRQQFVTYFKAQEKSKNAVKEINAVSGEQVIQFDAVALSAKGLVGTLEEVRDATGGNVDTIALLFPNIRALGSVLDLAGNQFERFKKITDQVTNSQGKFRAALEKQLIGPAKRVDIVTTGLRLGLASLGEQFIKGFFQVDEFGKSLDEVQGQALDLERQIKQFGEAVRGLGKILRGGSELLLSFISDIREFSEAAEFYNTDIRLMRTGTAGLQLAQARAAIAQDNYNKSVGNFDAKTILEAQIARKLLEDSEAALELTAAAENAVNAIFDLGDAANEIATKSKFERVLEVFEAPFQRGFSDAEEALAEGPLRARAGFVLLASEIRNSADQMQAVQNAFASLDLAARQILQKSTPEGLKAIEAGLDLNVQTAEALAGALRRSLTDELGRGSKNAAAAIAQLVELQRKADNLFKRGGAAVEKFTPVIRDEFVALLQSAFEGGIPLPREATAKLIEQIFSPAAANEVKKRFAEIFEFEVAETPEQKERVKQQAIGVIDETIRALRAQGKVVTFELEFLEGVERPDAQAITDLFDRRAAQLQNETAARLAELEKQFLRQQLTDEERARGEDAVQAAAARTALEYRKQQDILLEGIAAREGAEQRVRDQVVAVNAVLQDTADVTLRLADPAGKTADEFARAQANAQAFNELQLASLRAEERAVAEVGQRLLLAEQEIALQQSSGQISKETADLRRKAANDIYNRELELAVLQRERAREERRLASEISLQQLQDELANTFQAQITGIDQWAATAKFEAEQVGIALRTELTRRVPTGALGGILDFVNAQLQEQLRLIEQVAERRRDVTTLQNEERLLAQQQGALQRILELEDQLTGGIKGRRFAIEEATRAQIAQVEIQEAQGLIASDVAERTVRGLRAVEAQQLRNLQLSETAIRRAFEAEQSRLELQSRLLDDLNLEAADGFWDTFAAGWYDFADGFTASFQNMIDSLETWGQLGGRVFDTFMGYFDRYLNALAEGQTSFSEFARQFLREVAVMIAKMAILAALKAFVAGIAGPAATAPGSGLGADIALDDAAPIRDFARGGIMPGSMLGTLPVKNYANGGVANSPQLAIFGEGNNRRYGEAFVPLGPSRKIPVEMKMPKSESAGSRTANVTLNVQSLDPTTAADTILANMPQIQTQIAAALASGSDRNLVTAVRGV